MAFQKGHKINNGRKSSEEKKKKLRETKMGNKNPNYGKKGYWTGKQRSKETKIKIGLANSISLKGKKQSIESRIKKSKALTGEKNHQWQGGINPENLKIRNGIEIRLWRESVFARDNWTDQKTGIRGEELKAHHIQNFAQFPELRTSIKNSITLSKNSHIEFHKKYGFKNNTKEQLQEFLSTMSTTQPSPLPLGAGGVAGKVGALQGVK